MQMCYVVTVVQKFLLNVKLLAQKSVLMIVSGVNLQTVQVEDSLVEDQMKDFVDDIDFDDDFDVDNIQVPAFFVTYHNNRVHLQFLLK